MTLSFIVGLYFVAGRLKLSMAASTGAAATGSSARNFSQVVFVDIPHSYPPSAPVTCSYTLTDAFKSSSRDWVGIFKVRKWEKMTTFFFFLKSGRRIRETLSDLIFFQVGWSTTKDYHTFVWAEPCLDVGGQQPVTCQAVFRGRRRFHFYLRLIMLGHVCLIPVRSPWTLRVFDVSTVWV